MLHNASIYNTTSMTK